MRDVAYFKAFSPGPCVALRQLSDLRLHRRSSLIKLMHSPMYEKPKLIVSPWVKGRPLHYECSVCGHKFMLNDDDTPDEGTKELWAAFTEHVRNQHPSEK